MKTVSILLQFKFFLNHHEHYDVKQSEMKQKCIDMNPFYQVDVAKFVMEMVYSMYMYMYMYK